jgi:hypothetical protein
MAHIAFVVIFEFPWQFGFGAFALYLIGIAQTLADVSYTYNRLPQYASTDLQSI